MGKVDEADSPPSLPSPYDHLAIEDTAAVAFIKLKKGEETGWERRTR